MFDDKKFGWLFPTRTGVPSGTANERKMLDAIGGADGFKTRVQKNSDGSTTTLRTKNGHPEFTTSGSIAATVEPLTWTYDFNAVKDVAGALVPDTLSFSNTVFPRWDSGKGLKTRRAGLVPLGDGTYALSVSESGYDAYNTPNIMRGPNYWYNKDAVVTWTIDTWMPTAPDDYGQRFIGVVQYKNLNFEVCPVTAANNTVYPIIIAACLVRGDQAPDRVRVATIVGGSNQDLRIIDYVEGVELSRSTLRFPFAVSGFSVAPVSVSTAYFSFSTGGDKLIVAVNDVLGRFPKSNTCKAAIITITQATTIGGVTLYSFPVETPNNSTVSTGWVSSSSGGEDYSVNGLSPEDIAGWINSSTGEWVYYTPAAPTSGGSYGKTPYTSSSQRPGSTVQKDGASILHVGFSGDDTPCAVITRLHTTKKSGGEVTITNITDDMSYSNPQIHIAWGYKIVNYCTSGEYRYRNTASTVAGAYEEYVQTIYVCNGTNIIFQDSDTCSASRGGSGTYDEFRSTSKAYTLNSNTSGNVIEPPGGITVGSTFYAKGGSVTNGRVAYKYDISCPVADFLAGVVVIAKTSQYFIGGYSDIRDYALDNTRKTIYDVTTRVYAQNPDTYTVTYKVIDKGVVKSSYQISKPTPEVITGLENPKSFVGTADYRAKDGALLMLHSDDTLPFGLYFKDGAWSEVAPNPSEPNPQYAHPVKVSKLSHY